MLLREFTTMAGADKSASSLPAIAFLSPTLHLLALTFYMDRSLVPSFLLILIQPLIFIHCFQASFLQAFIRLFYTIVDDLCKLYGGKSVAATREANIPPATEPLYAASAERSMEKTAVE
jgi:hypothetical protein